MKTGNSSVDFKNIFLISFISNSPTTRWGVILFQSVFSDFVFVRLYNGRLRKEVISVKNAKEFARKVSHAGFKNIVLQTSASKGITRVAIKKVPASKVTDTQNKLTAAGFTEQSLRQRKD